MELSFRLILCTFLTMGSEKDFCSIEINEVLSVRVFRSWLWGYGIILILTLMIAHWSSEAVTVLAENRPVIRSSTIIIDAGHGGVDGGATSCTGVLESKFNLEISLRLNDLLRLLGHNTLMIRTEDISVYTNGQTIGQKKISDLKERVRRINETEDAILLSIHQNHFPDARYAGAQVFYADTEGSADLAKQLQEAFRKSLNPGSNRQEKKSSGIYLMEHIQCPGVLIECGFLSNPEEEARLRTAQYQQKICTIIASVTGSFKSNT